MSDKIPPVSMGMTVLWSSSGNANDWVPILVHRVVTGHAEAIEGVFVGGHNSDSGSLHPVKFARYIDDPDLTPVDRENQKAHRGFGFWRHTEFNTALLGLLKAGKKKS